MKLPLDSSDTPKSSESLRCFYQAVGSTKHLGKEDAPICNEIRMDYVVLVFSTLFPPLTHQNYQSISFFFNL